MKNAVSVSPTMVEVVDREAVICGNAAEYMSVAIGGTALSAASVSRRAG